MAGIRAMGDLSHEVESFLAAIEVGHVGGRCRRVRRAAELARRVAPDARDGQLGPAPAVGARTHPADPGAGSGASDCCTHGAGVCGGADRAACRVHRSRSRDARGHRTRRGRTRHGSRAAGRGDRARDAAGRGAAAAIVIEAPAEPPVVARRPNRLQRLRRLPQSRAAHRRADGRCRERASRPSCRQWLPPSQRPSHLRVSWCRPRRRCLPRTRSLQRRTRRCCRGASPSRRRSAANWRVSMRTCSTTC